MTEWLECPRCCGNGQTYGPNSGEDIICPDCKGTGRLGVALRKVLPVEPLPPEFVRLCEELDRAQDR